LTPSGRSLLVLASAATVLLSACRTGDRLLVSNTTAVPIVFNQSTNVPACSNAAFEFRGSWRPAGQQGEPAVPPSPIPGAIEIVIDAYPPIDGFGSTRTVAIVSESGVKIRDESDDPPSPSLCKGRPP
jgi:hypothetical protein